jgi:hypothetical protein
MRSTCRRSSAHIDLLAQPGVAAGMRGAARAAVEHLGLAAMSERLLLLSQPALRPIAETV